MKYKQLLWLASLVMCFCVVGLAAQTTVTIGTGTDLGSYPLYDYDTYSRSQALYLASEIGTSGLITKLRWYRDNTGANPNAIGLTEIWLRQYIPSTLNSPDWEDPGTLVASIANIDLGSGGAWYEVDITDFEYSGANLLVSVRTQDAPYVSPHAQWRSTYVYPQHLSRESHDYYYNPPDYMVYGNVRPNIQLEIEAVTPTAPPNFAIDPSPGDSQTGVLSDAILQWYSGGGMPAGFHLYFGTDNPPANIVNGLDLGNVYSYTPTAALSYGQTYYWQIVPYNSIGSTSACPVWSFSTVAAIESYPYHYGFEQASFPAEGWSAQIDQGATGWQRLASSSSSPSANPHNGSWLGYYNCRALSNGSTARLISPPVQRTDPNYEYELTFWMYRDIGWSTRADKINVWLGPRDISSATLLGTIHRSKSLTPVETGSNTWYQYSFPLPAGATDFITFEAISANGNNILLDDIYISRAPLGGLPPGLATNPYPADGEINISPDVLLSWNAPDGEVTSYDVTVRDASNTVVLVANTSSTSLPMTDVGYNENYHWVVDPVNNAGSASQTQQLPVWSFTTMPPNVSGSYPTPGALDWNPYNRLLDWNPLPGAQSYLVSIGTAPGNTDIANSVEVTETKYVHPTDFPQNSNNWWQVNPVRNGNPWPGEWKQFSTGGLPPVVMPQGENFDAVAPPGLPTGWRKVITSTGCANVGTIANASMSAPNSVYFNAQDDVAAQLSLISPPLNPANKNWVAEVSFDAYCTNTSGTVLVEAVSDQSDSPQVYYSQSVVLDTQPSRKVARLPIPANIPAYARITADPYNAVTFVDNYNLGFNPAEVPRDFEIIKVGNQIKLRWSCWGRGYYDYKVYAAYGPDGPFTVIQTIDYNYLPTLDGHYEVLVDPALGDKLFFHVTSLFNNPYNTGRNR